MKYKLIAMDFDGTLLTDDKKVSSWTKKELQKLKAEGYKIVGATARTLDSVKNVLDTNMFHYIILNNGVSIYDVDRDTDEWMGYITLDIASKIIDEVFDDCLQIDLISGTKYYIYKYQKKSSLPFIVDIDRIEDVSEKLARMNVFFNDGVDVLAYYEKIKKQFSNVNCFVMQSSDDNKKWLVVNPIDIDKKVTLSHLGDELGISLDEMIFFGDGLNDLEVLEGVGLGVGMGNALDEVLDKVDAVTDTNNCDGIAKFLVKMKNI